jgi:Tol biopolymer transport system component
MRRLIMPGVWLGAACGARLSGNPAEVDTPDAAAAAPSDAATPPEDAPPDALQFGPWSSPAKVGVAATAAAEDDVTLSSNALEMIFAVQATNGKDLYYTSRPTIDGAWTPVVKLPFDTTAATEETPRFSGDDLTLYFASDPVTSGNLDIYATKRPAAGSATTWTKPALVPTTSGINTAAAEKWFSPCGTDRYALVRANASGVTHLFEGTLSGGAPAPIDSLNSLTANDTGAFLTQDCLTIYFASQRVTPEKIFVSHRASITAPWEPASPVDDFKITGGDGNQEDPWLSPDGHTFALASDAAGNKDVYLSKR